VYLPLSSSGVPWAAVARCRLRQQSSGEPPRLAGGQSGPGADPVGRRADVEADAPGRVAAAATITVIAAISGMRASELMELQVGCRRLEEFSPGLVRHKIASKVVKGQPLGGTQDEWVVIQPVYQAAGLAEQLHDDPRAANRYSAGSSSGSATRGSATG
jgi:hypothetical protein